MAPTRLVIDAGVALRIVEERIVVRPGVALVSPVLMRSLVLERLYRDVVAGARQEDAALEVNARFAKLKVRYLGDAVLRRRAWAIARRAEMQSTHLAEYLALTQLQADALATEDAELTHWAEGIVEVVPFRAISE